MLKTYTCKRDGDRSLVFDGELLGESSSHRDGAERWFEVAIYRTEAGAYVVHGVGVSTVDGETDRHWAIACDDGETVVAELTRVDKDNVEYLTRTARDALSAASQLDDGIRSAFLQRVA